ncbi:MAG TPA: metal ABC transporter permease [Oscillatoriaceae cyanobacterium]
MFDALSLDFMQRALAISVIVAVVCAVLGVYVVLRRIVFVGAALSQISTAGLAFALLVGLSPNPTAFVVTLLGVTLLAFLTGGKRLSQESLLGLAYAACSAGTVLLIWHAAQGMEDIKDLMFGNMITAKAEDLWLVGGAGALVLITHLVCRRPFLFVSYDPEMARTLGYKTVFWNWLFYLTLGVAIAAVTKIAGSLLTFAFLVIPAMTALSIAKGTRTIFAIAALSAAIAAFVGLLLSFNYDLPTGPAMVAVSTALLLLAAAGGGLVRKLRPA